MIEAGTPVTIKIKRPNRWTTTAVEAFDLLTGVVEEVKPDNGNNNILVRFAKPVDIGNGIHKKFHFLEEDLTEAARRPKTLVRVTKRRKHYTMDMLDLNNLIEYDNFTCVWDTYGGGNQDRGVLWTQDDECAGFFTVDNWGFVHVTLETGQLIKWC